MEDLKNSTRALRRHHAARLKKVRKEYWSHRHGVSQANQMDERQLGMVIATPKLCSCFGCGNPRKWFNEKTIDEMKWQQFSAW